MHGSHPPNGCKLVNFVSLEVLGECSGMACACVSQTTGSASAWSSGMIVAFPPNVPGPLVTHPSLQVCTAHTRVPRRSWSYLFILRDGSISDSGVGELRGCSLRLLLGIVQLGSRSFPPRRPSWGLSQSRGPPPSSWTLHKGVRFKSSHRPIF